MHILTLFVEGIATPFALHYRGEAEAGASLNRVLSAKWEDDLLFKDDFGQTISVNRGAIKVPVLIDVARGLDVQLEISKQQQKAARSSAGGSTLVTPRNGIDWPQQ